VGDPHDDEPGRSERARANGRASKYEDGTHMANEYGQATHTTTTIAINAIDPHDEEPDKSKG
jgi:hypothetical protein